MHPLLRQSARRLLGPRAFSHAQLRLARWRGRRSPDDGTAAATAELVDRVGLVVLGGPFTGLRFPAAERHEVHMLAAKLLGAYEAELHGAVERLVARAPTCVVNIGAGDGYYAIGLAMRLPQAEVVAVDIDERARRVTAAVADVNGSGDRVRVVSTCAPEDLEPLAGVNTLVVADCESYEHELLDPDKAPALARTAMLVELHDHIDRRITPTLERRFAATHEVERIDTVARPPAAYPPLAGLEPALAAELLNEHRPGAMTWAVLVPR